MKPNVGTFCLSINSGDSILLDSTILITIANKKTKRPMAAKIYIKAPRTLKIERIKKLTEGLINEKDHSAHMHSEKRDPQPGEIL